MAGYIIVTASQAGPAASRTGEKRKKRTEDDDDTESIIKKLEDLYD